MLPGLSRGWVLLAALAVHSLGCADAPAQPARLGLKLAPATLGVIAQFAAASAASSDKAVSTSSMPPSKLTRSGSK